MPATPATPQQFEALLDRLTEAVRAATPPAPAAPAVAETAPVPLHELSNEQLGRRLLRGLSENHASPWWAGVRENADDTAAAPAGLAEQVQALPLALPSMSLTGAMTAAHDLQSPSWTRTPPRTVFTEPGR